MFFIIYESLVCLNPYKIDLDVFKMACHHSKINVATL